MMYHIPVLLNECIEGLNIRPEGTYVDVTFGSGGHSRGILEKLTTGRLIAFDQDPDAAQNLIHDDRFLFIQQNFRYLKNFLKFNGIHQIDGLLADLGISSWQIDRPDRGFSTRSEGPLDMRMNQAGGNSAADIINNYATEQLAGIFRKYGEIDNAGKLAAEIGKARDQHQIENSAGLKEIAVRLAPRGKENQYLAKVYQAIRIEVNEELAALAELLISTEEILVPGGRFVVLSYHSLEDRLVKNFFRTGNLEGKPVKDFYGNLITTFRPVNRKAIVPSPKEQANNPRSRSAKLRIAEKNG
ncbi:MAG: 16S rRNA (cytosine(1402)-N(4))-methyltransferase RsmH [Bacteroidales bacterium]|jgi:16S rRNA (cytosine1402-N4)-methyltransferase|nr:16S rRNA (cytosine(1402)-N(4))-methyltransferase RsmH [Bacteroidales bacterium]